MMGKEEEGGDEEGRDEKTGVREGGGREGREGGRERERDKKKAHVVIASRRTEGTRL